MQSSDTLAAVSPVVNALEQLGVTYYLGGSIVSSTYGLARSTLDVDLVADLAQRHVQPLTDALRPVYYVDAHMISDAIARKSCFNVIHLATMFKVDVFAVGDRPYDRAALARIRRDTLAVESAAAEFFMASPEDIILNKLEWFRLGDEVSRRQWDDVIGVLKVQQTRLDGVYLTEWAGKLGIADLLDRAQRESET